MKNLIVGSAIVFVGLTGTVIKANSSSNVDLYIEVDKDYNDFLLRQFDNSNLMYELEEEIYPKNTQNSLPESDFNYQITSSLETKQYNENWKLDLFCATNPQTPLEECNVVVQREVQDFHNIEMAIFFLKKLYSVNRYPGLLIFLPFLLTPYFLKRLNFKNAKDKPIKSF